MTHRVVIRTKNSAWVLDQCLAALFRQAGVAFTAEVVDSGSRDATLEVAARYPVQIHRIDSRDYFPGDVLNAAMARSHDPVVVFLNSDAVMLHDRVLATLLACLDDSEVQAAFARQVARPEAWPWVRADYLRSYPDRGSAPSWQPLSLPLAAMRRAAWETQPFYQDAWGSEDTHWGQRALERGWRIAYEPRATVMHSHNYTLRESYGRSFIEGEADAFLQPDGLRGLAWLRRLAGACWRDLRSHPASCWRAAPYRCAWQWGHWRGYRHGAARRQRGDRERETGQTVVLESQRP